MRNTAFIALLLAAATAYADDPPNAARVPFPDESIYVAQERAYTKRGHFEITPMFGATLNNRYTSALGGALGLTYHVRENFGIEAIGGYVQPSYTAAVGELFNGEQAAPFNAELKQMQWFAGGDLQWAPFYGKLRLVPGVLGVFDVYISAGFAAVATRSPCTPGAIYNGNGIADGSDIQGIKGNCPARPNNSLPSDTHLAGNFGAGIRIFFTSFLGVRIELRDLVYSDNVVVILPGGSTENVSTTIRHQVFIFLGVSFLI